MIDPVLSDTLDRAERALDRIERASARTLVDGRREAALRDKVSAVIAELDDMIRTAGAR